MTTWTKVQSKQNTAGGGVVTSVSVTLNSAVTNGSIVVGGLFFGVGSGGVGNPKYCTSVTDDKGNHYKVFPQTNDENTGTNLAVAAFRSVAPITNGPTVITATFSGSTSTVCWILADEFATPSGTVNVCLDSVQATIGNNTTSFPGFQTLNNNVLVWALAISTGVATTGAAWQAGQGSGTNFMSEWGIVTSPTNPVTVQFGSNTGQIYGLAVGIAPVAQTRWEPVQNAAFRQTTGSTTCVATFPNPVTSGNIVAGVLAADDGTKLTSIIDNQSNHYSVIPGATGGLGGGVDYRQSFWSGKQLTNGPQTITATYSTSQSVNFILMTEFAPPPNTASVALDGNGVNTFISTSTPSTPTSITTPNITTTRDDELCYAWADNAVGNSNDNNVPLNGFSRSNYSGTWCDVFLIKTPAGSINASFACQPNGADYNASLNAFRATPIASGRQTSVSVFSGRYAKLTGPSARFTSQSSLGGYGHPLWVKEYP